MIDRFCWRSYDLNSLLPAGWRAKIISVATSESVRKVLRPRSVTSREGSPDLSIPVATVSGLRVKESLPWLHSLYVGLFRDLAQLGTHEPVLVATNPLYGAVLNVQSGTGMRYEAHVDSNPIEGLLYVTTHVEGAGGELVVANNSSADSVAGIDADCSIVYPVSGNLVFFDARRFPHYVRALRAESDVRVVVAMNFYTPSCPESARPADLNAHLFGSPT
jgi:hypothetical protein